MQIIKRAVVFALMAIRGFAFTKVDTMPRESATSEEGRPPEAAFRTSQATPVAQIVIRE